MHDVCIVGAGPAGLNAALVLGRCRRDVVVFDSGQPRNAASRGLHCFLSRDGILPLALRELGRREVAAYPTVTFIDATVASARRRDHHIELVTADGRATRARRLLLATGRIDVLPEPPGFRTFYGRGVYHCPYCDGWEHRDGRLIAYGDAPAAASLALELRTWSRRVTLATPEPDAVPADRRDQLAAAGVAIAPSPVAELAGTAGDLEFARLANGDRVPCDAVFFTSAVPQKSALAQSLGCQLDAGGSVICTRQAATGVPGVFVAGNVRGGVHLAIMAAAEGAEAAIAINDELADADLRGLPVGGPPPP